METRTTPNITPRSIKRNRLSPVEPVAIGVLPSTALVDNGIPYKKVPLELPLKSLKQQGIKKHQSTAWVVNTIGDTLHTGRPYCMVGERKIRVQLPRRKALDP